MSPTSADNGEPSLRPDMVFDPAALAAYQRAAARVSDLLGEAATHTSLAAGADLSGLGTLGAEFAAAWTQAATDHAATLNTAGSVVADIDTILTRYGITVTDTDTDVAHGLSATQEAMPLPDHAG